MHHHAPELPHAVGAGNGLILDRGLDLRLAEDDDAGCLDIEARAARLHLADEHRAVPGGGEGVHDRLPSGG